MLGLDLAIQSGTLRFFQGMAELFGSADLIERLSGMGDELMARDNEAAAKAEQAVNGLRGGVLAALDARGIACPDDARARLRECDDPATLQRWLLRAMTAGSAAETLAG